MERVSSQHARGTQALVFSRRALLGLALLTLVACGAPLGATPSPGPAGGSRGSATPTSAVAFPQFAPVAGERGDLAALLEGTLTLVDDCLRVTLRSDNDLIIWPPEVTLRTDGGDIRVIDTAGRVVARVGEEVRLSGGQLKTVGGQGLREAPPARCPGPYWLTGEILGPEPSPAAAPRDAERENEPPDNDFELVGTKWALISLDGEALLAGTTITLNVGSKQLGGSAGCNGYGARYTAPGGGALTVVEIGGTAMGCPAPEGIMEQERRYLGLLQGVATYHLDDGRLRLETGDSCSRATVIARWPCTSPGRTLVFTARD